MIPKSLFAADRRHHTCLHDADRYVEGNEVGGIPRRERDPRGPGLEKRAPAVAFPFAMPSGSPGSRLPSGARCIAGRLRSALA